MNISNATIAIPDQATNPLLAVYNAVTTIIAFFLNIAVLSVYTFRVQHKTPFSLYVANLLLSNIFACFTAFLDLTKLIYQSKHAESSSLCAAQFYWDYSFSGLVAQAHALISINRIWAVIRPISYRNLHTGKTALIICAVSHLYMQLIVIPYFIYRSLNVTNSCSDFDPDIPFTIFNQIVVYDIPSAVVIAAFPVIWWAQRKRMSQISDNEFLRRRESSMGANKTTHWDKSFLTLTGLTVTLLVFWMPAKVYFSALFLAGVDLGQICLAVMLTLSTLQAVSDPICFVLTFHDLKEAVLRSLKRKT